MHINKLNPDAILNLESTSTSTKEIVRHVGFCNLEELYAGSKEAICLNEIPLGNKDYAQQRNRMLFSRSGDLSFIASCECGHYFGNYYKGQICNICHSEVIDDFAAYNKIQHKTWLSIPHGIKVLHPMFYKLLTNSWLKSGYLEAILNPNAQLPPELEMHIDGQGYVYFYENFDKIIDYFARINSVTSKKPITKDILEVIAKNRDLVFTNKLPILSSVVHSVTNDGTHGGRQFVDSGSKLILNAATDLQCISDRETVRVKTLLKTIYDVYSSYISYIDEIISDRIGAKRSIFRGQILGTRTHFSFRGVICPHEDKYDHLYLPWSMGVNTYKDHIIGRLIDDYKMAPGDAVLRQRIALVEFDKDINDIFIKLINDSPFEGLPTTFCRHPCLKRGGVQFLYITKFKTNIHDNTINIGVPVSHVTKDPNAKLIGLLESNFKIEFSLIAGKPR